MKKSVRRGIAPWILTTTVIVGLTAGPAHALFPPPFFYPPGGIVGEPDPDPIIPLPPPIVDPPVDPPCDCTCPPGRPNNVPEPTTLVSGLIGLVTIGGVALRRQIRRST
jgi:hypothetical protein